MKPMLAQLRKALNLSAKATLSRHPAGAVNHVYHLHDASCHVSDNKPQGLSAAVKWLGNDNFSGVDRRQQFYLQHQLADVGAAPRPLWLNDDETLWVERWEESSGIDLTPQDLALVLTQLHQLPVNAGPLNLSKRWQHYIEVAGLAEHTPLFIQAMKLQEQLKASEQEAENYVLCHNDLLRGHVLRPFDSPPLVIDWEYAAMGNRYFDIAACCMINKFNQDESEALVRAYAKKMSLSATHALEHYRVHLDFVAITNELWTAAMDATESKGPSVGV